MAKTQLARKIYAAYSTEAFGELALPWDRLRPHEKHFWLTAAQAALDAINVELYGQTEEEFRERLRDNAAAEGEIYWKEGV